jgi:dUTP pyrophosphatase
MRVYLDPRLAELGLKPAAPKPGDAGYDLYALDAATLPSWSRALIATGVYLEIPPGYVGLVKDRSSMALAGLHTMGGVIDSGYRGEIRIILLNTNDTDYVIRAGHKIAQIIVIPCYTEALTAVESLDALSATERGAGGFGSTGE